MTQDSKAVLILIVTTILAAFGWIFSKQAIAGLPPYGFIGLRFILASLLLLPLCYHQFAKVTRVQLRNSALVGLFMSGALILWVHAISVTDTLSEGAFISSLAMLFAPLVAWLVFKQRPAYIFWVSLPFAIVGLALLSLSGGFHSSPSQVWFLLSAIVLAFHFNFNAKFAQSVPSLVLACIQMFITGCVGIIFSFLFETWPVEISSETWTWFLLSAVLATSIRYTMQTLGQKMTTAGNAAIIMILEPVWASGLSVIWYGDAMPVGKVIGCALILWSLFVYRGGAKLLEARRFKKLDKRPQ